MQNPEFRGTTKQSAESKTFLSKAYLKRRNEFRCDGSLLDRV